MNDARPRICLVCLLLVSTLSYASGQEAGAPTPKVIQLASSGKDVTPVLAGPPESVKMRSGLVILAPGKSVGRHSTAQNEELLVVFEGQGEMSFKDGSELPVKANSAVYCPPQTEHNVTNTGTGTLRYVYVVSSAR